MGKGNSSSQLPNWMGEVNRSQEGTFFGVFILEMIRESWKDFMPLRQGVALLPPRLPPSLSSWSDHDCSILRKGASHTLTNIIGNLRGPTPPSMAHFPQINQALSMVHISHHNPKRGIFVAQREPFLKTGGEESNGWLASTLYRA